MKLKAEKNSKKEKEIGVKVEKNVTKLKNKKKKLIIQQATSSDNESLPKTLSQPETEKPKGEALIKSVDTSIFQYFKELANENEQERMKAAFKLLQQLAKTKDAEKRSKELTYTLKRLIRGCGAATNSSRSGFYTGLVALLKSYNVEELPLSLVFEVLEKELHVGSVLTNKEDSDAVVGRLLICSAILYTNRIQNINKDDLNKMTTILLSASKYKSYHVSLGYTFFAELLEQVNESQFKDSIWPLLQTELSKPWPKQSIQTMHCVIKAQSKFPKLVNIKYMKSVFGGAELLNDESFEYLYKIFWEHTNIDILAHPALEEFGAYAANCSKLVDFWQGHINEHLEKPPTKLMELITLKITTDILNNINEENASKVLQILSDNFVKMIVEGLKVIKQRKDETIKAFYTEFFESIVKCSSKLKEDSQKVAVIKRLILKPGTFDIEKYTGTRITHQLINFLNEEGIRDLFALYKSIFLNSLPKSTDGTGDTWSQFERLNAGYMLQYLLLHKNIQRSFKWRREQLQTLLTFGIFHVDGSHEVCQKSEQSSFSETFAEQCRNMFFTCLQSKFIDLPQEHKILFKLVESCNSHLQDKSYKKLIRLKNFDSATYEAWNRMYKAVSTNPLAKKKSGDNKDNLQMIFQILLLSMGLHLFKEPEMAIPSIDDLLKCLEKTNKKQKEKKKNASKINPEEEEEEPEWIEVVVDLLLHLLSQNSSSLRQIVDGLFTHLCGSLNLNAVHHILSMLDMKDGNNPLSTKAEAEDDDDDDEDDEDEDEDDDEGDEEAAEGSDSQDAEDDDDESDDDDDEDEDEDMEDVSNADKLRNAISQALIETGAGVLARDDDMDSIDLNDISEEEGRKLDEALANAFKAMKQSSNLGVNKKKTKVYRVQTTTVMHFRIRVLDLIEIYLQKNPSLMMVTEILLAIFNMLEFCIGEELKPLHVKVEKVLSKLAQMKAAALEADLTEENLVDFIRLLVEKKTVATAYNSTNVLRNKCVVFLINCSMRVSPDTAPKKLIKLFEEYVQDFIQHRNPTMNITLITDIFKMRWPHVWPIALSLVKVALTKETRGFRRLQTFEALSTLYSNINLLKLDAEATNKHLSKLEKPISGFIISLSEAADVRQTPKEFQNLLELLIAVQKAHKVVKTESTLCSSDIGECIQTLRKLVRLENFNTYQHYCSVFGLQLIRNKDLESSKHQNGKAEGKTNDSEESSSRLTNGHHEEEDVDEDSETLEKSKKRKAKMENGKDLRKEKKQKKKLRLEASSKGLVEGHNFVTSTNGLGSAEESDENDNDDDNEA